MLALSEEISQKIAQKNEMSQNIASKMVKALG